MFRLHDFIMMGLKDAIGKMADYQVILNAAAWQEKGVLDNTDLAEIAALMEAKNFVPEEVPEIPEEVMIDGSENSL